MLKIMNIIFVSLNEPTKELTLIGDELINDFLNAISGNSLPDTNGIVNIEEPLIYTADLKENIENLVSKYKHIIPQIHRIKNDFFSHLEDNEQFFMLPQEQFNQKIELEVREYLIAIKEGKSLETVKNDFESYMGEIFNSYQIFSYGGNKKTYIGEPDKSKRVCRYCGGSKSNGYTEFKKIGHTISEALGNKNIITNDECDQCNWKFGTQIEQDLINLFSPLNTIFSIKGKNGVPHTKGINFEIAKEGNNFHMKYYLSEEEKMPEFDGSHFDIYNKLASKVTFQNCYKALVKYAIGVLPSEFLNSMGKTIEWLNKEDLDEIALPLIAIRQHIDSFVTHPIISVYIRKTEDFSLPYAVGEFRYTMFKIVFIVPFTNNSSCNFTNQAEYEHFWSTFKLYSSLDSWKFVDWSSRRLSLINYHFHFSPQIEGESNNVEFV